MPHLASYTLQSHQHLDARETALTCGPAVRLVGGGLPALSGQGV